MFGKGSLIVAAGMSLVMGTYSLKLNRLTVTNAGNVDGAFVRAAVHEGALSGMNYGINHVWVSDEDHDTGHYVIVSPQCTTFVSIQLLGSDTLIVMSVGRSSLLVEDYYLEGGGLEPIVDTVYAMFSNNCPLSRWAAYSNQDNGIEWTTGDTSWGPVHCNHNVRLNGEPVFYGKVTARLGISPNPSGNGCDAELLGGWEIGIDAPLPSNMNLLRNRASQDNDGADINTKCLYNVDVEFEFLSDGNVIRTIPAAPVDTVLLTTIAPGGIIYNTGDFAVSGVVNGAVTLLSDGSINIVNDLVYSSNPLTDETCDDILGLIAENDVMVIDNEANNSDVNINACIFAVTGSFTAQNYASRPVSGRLTVIGSIAQAGRGHVATVSPWDHSVTHGFSKSYYYDPRLRTMSPPHFPSVKKHRLVSWWE